MPDLNDRSFPDLSYLDRVESFHAEVCPDCRGILKTSDYGRESLRRKWSAALCNCGPVQNMKFNIGDRVRGTTATGKDAEGLIIRVGKTALLLDCGQVISSAGAEVISPPAERVQITIFDQLGEPPPEPVPLEEPAVNLPPPQRKPKAKRPPAEQITIFEALTSPEVLALAELPPAEVGNTVPAPPAEEPAPPPKKKRGGIEFPPLAPGEAALNDQRVRIRVYQALINERLQLSKQKYEAAIEEGTPAALEAYKHWALTYNRHHVARLQLLQQDAEDKIKQIQEGIKNGRYVAAVDSAEGKGEDHRRRKSSGKNRGGTNDRG